MFTTLEYCFWHFPTTEYPKNARKRHYKSEQTQY